MKKRKESQERDIVWSFSVHEKQVEGFVDPKVRSVCVSTIITPQ